MLWQAFPVAAAGVAALGWVAWRALGQPPRAVTIATVGLAGLLLITGAALLVLLPTRFLPEPTGPHPIGTTTFAVVDHSRPDLFAPGHPRTLTAQAWYPAAPGASGPVDPYVRDPHAFAGLADYAHAPEFLLSHLAVAPTHALVDAPAAGQRCTGAEPPCERPAGEWGCTGAEPPCERFPVVVFVTGNLGYRQSNMVQVEELASHGFVVVAFDQPGTASSVLFPDGRRVPYAGRDVLKPLIDQSIEAVEPAPELAGTPYPDGIASYLAADGRAVLDHLATLDADPASPLAGRLDLDRVGAFGISLGGYTVSQWCATDPRLDACLFMDASMTLDARAQGLDAPALWLTRTAEDMAAEGWPSVEVRHFDGTQRALFAETRAPAWYVTVAGRLHNDFTDAPYGSPVLSWMGLTSAADPDETHAIMRGTTLAFFDHALRGGPPGVLDAPPWPGVEVVSHGTP